jgi:hypothetical protein
MQRVGFLSMDMRRALLLGSVRYAECKAPNDP